MLVPFKLRLAPYMWLNYTLVYDYKKMHMILIHSSIYLNSWKCYKVSHNENFTKNWVHAFLNGNIRYNLKDIKGTFFKVHSRKLFNMNIIFSISNICYCLHRLAALLVKASVIGWYQKVLYIQVLQYLASIIPVCMMCIFVYIC